jgi:hypothetical protein
MDEMKLIEDMCAEVSAPDQSRLAALRARILGEAARTPLPDRPPQPRRTPWPDRSGRFLTLPRLAWTAGTAVALVAVLAVTGVIPLRGSGLGPPASAAVLLDRAAAAAQAQPTPTDRQLIYSETAIYSATYRPHGASVPTGHVTVRQQEWQSPNSPNAFYRATPCDIDGNPQGGHAACSFEGGYAPGATRYSTFAGLRTLPTDTSGLLAYLAGLPSGGHSRAGREWSGANLIASLNPVLPARFAAALFRAAAQIPGTVLVRAATNAAGAHGIGIARPVAGVQEELIFDPGSYRLIGQQSAALHLVRGQATGYVVSATALLHASFVSSGPGTGTGSSAGGGPRDGQFIYTDTNVVGRLPQGHRLALQRGSQQMWQSVDGSKPGALGTAPCHAGRAACLVLIPPGPQTPALTTYAGLTALPRRPGALLSYLHRHNTCSAPARTATARPGNGASEWDMVTAIFGNNQVMPPGLGKALFETATKIPGAVVLRHVADAAGGAGIAVARNESPQLRTELIFAPRSYRFIGVQDVLTRGAPGLRPGAVWAASALVAAKVVNAAPITSLSQSYEPGTCGFMPGFYTTSASASGSSQGASSGSSSSG